MKKLIITVILVCFAINFAFSSQITYIFKNSISSTQMSEASIGDVYKDEANNRFIVSQKRGDVAEFDVVNIKSTPKEGYEIQKRFPLVYVDVSGGMKGFNLSCSMSCFTYPVSPMIRLGSDYSFSTVDCLLGARVDCPLSNYSDKTFTLLRNGFGYVYGLAGVDLTKTFVSEWGLGYRHALGMFNWGLGYNLTWKESEKSSDFSVCLGVML